MRQSPPSTERNARGLAAALALLALASAALNDRLLALRRDDRATEARSDLAGQSPFVAYATVGLAGFRGIVAEALWLRASWMQENGRYQELAQLADWITALDPRAADAWVYQAWNMAYNISVMLPLPEDRLRWVTQGISLLRDRAIPLNPAEARLYRELGWLYQHKIGSDSDEAHLYYKLSLAAVMTPWLDAAGQPPVPLPANAARHLRQRLRLDPERMQSLAARFGPLDWRLPETHAIYWALQGVERARGIERLACRRMVCQNLAASLGRGRFTGDAMAGDFRTAPNLAIVESACAFYEDTAREFPNRGTRSSFGYFLGHAVRLLAQARGNEAAARACYDRLQKLAASTRARISTFEELTGPERPRTLPYREPGDDDAP
jgi:hypothetical protein